MTLKQAPGLEARFFALRTPLLPVDEFVAWGEGLEGADASPADLEDALRRDRRRLRERLQAAYARAELREALFVASPSLEEGLQSWLENPESEHGLKVERALVRYFSRMTTRVTPFGTFVGVSLGTIGGRAHTLDLGARTTYRRHARLDMHYLGELCARLAGDAALRARLSYRPNTSLYRVGGHWRYAEARYQQGRRFFELVKVEASTALDRLLEQAAPGVSFQTLSDVLMATDADISREEADAFVDSVIEAEVLVSDLAPTVTGPEPIKSLLPLLRGPPPSPHAGPLGSIDARLDALAGLPPGVAPATYREIAQELTALPAPVDVNQLFQVDLIKPGTCALGESVAGEIARSAEGLARLVSPGPDRLAAFKSEFEARYGERFVPLAEALDEESGIGFESALGEPLLEGLPLSEEAPARFWTERDRFLGLKLSDLERRGAEEWVLSDDDVEALQSSPEVSLPNAFAAVVSLEAAGPDAVAAGNYRFSLSLTGSSGAEALGRFAHFHPELQAAVRAHLRQEEARRPEAIFVELAHLPADRSANLVLRPVLRGRELPFLGRSGAPAELQIPFSDVLISVRGGRVVLASRALQRELVVRNTTALNSELGLAVCRLLGRIEEQDGISRRWEWGAVGDGRSRLPRVVRGRCVLSLACWNLSVGQLHSLAAAGSAERFARLAALRRELALPRWFTIQDGGATLVIDTDNSLSADSFAHLAASRRELRVSEVFPALKRTPVRGPEGAFQNELIVPMLRTSRAPAPSWQPQPPEKLCRSFSPGDEWLYFKLYGGEAAADGVLQRVVRPLARAALASGAADRWFFIRFADPQPHLRLRLHGPPERLWREVAPALREAVRPCQNEGTVWRVQVDTYERELERYGGDAGMEWVEQIFWADSEAVVDILTGPSDEAWPESRWRVALLGLSHLLSDFGLTPAERLELSRTARDGLFRELGGDKRTEHALAERYRAERGTLTALLEDSTRPDFVSAREAYLRRSEVVRPAVAALRAGTARDPLRGPLRSLFWSLLHMHANRMLRSAARPQELVLYDFLARNYASQAARER